MTKWENEKAQTSLANASGMLCVVDNRVEFPIQISKQLKFLQYIQVLKEVTTTSNPNIIIMSTPEQ
jgi:hypothetical protein